MSQLVTKEQPRKLKSPDGGILELTELRFEGRIEASTIGIFQEVFERLHKAKKLHLAVDMSGVEYITSTGLGGLVKYFNLFRESGGLLALVSVPETVLHVTQLLGLQSILPIFDNMEQLGKEYKSKLEELDGATPASEKLTAQQNLSMKRAEASAGKVKAVDEKRKGDKIPIILAVPEENLFSMLVMDILENHNIRVLVAKNEEEAFDLVSRENAAAIIVDFLMPGYESLCQKLKLTPHTSTCSIILLYQHGSSPNKVDELTILPNEHIVEPFPLDKLASLVKSEIERKRAEASFIQHEMHFRFPSSMRWINQANKLIKKLLNKPFGLDREAYLAISSSVREAIDNANRHGNKEEPSKFIDVIYLLDIEKTTISIKDCGEGFDHSTYLKTIKGKSAAELAERRSFGSLGGLGIALMVKCTDDLVYNSKGNEVTQIKRLKNGAGAHSGVGV